MRHSHAHYIELEAAQLPVGESMRGICPACEGGRSDERSLLITREAWGLRAHCFRATCNFGTRVTGSAGELSDVPLAPANEPTHYLGTFEELDGNDRAYFWKRFYLRLSEVQSYIGYNDLNQYVMPIWDKHDLRQGYVVRQKPWGGEVVPPRMPRNPYHGMARKVKSYPDTPDTIMMSVYRPLETLAVPAGTIVLTEDQISAMKAAQTGAVGVALLGVGLNLDKVRELQRLHPKRVLVALDPDASHLAFQMVGKWGSAFPTMRVILPDTDLKDMYYDDVLDLIRGEVSDE